MSDVVPVGAVQSMKDELANKEATALARTPEGMDFVGWMLDGWVVSYTMHSSRARPVYAFSEVV